MATATEPLPTAEPQQVNSKAQDVVVTETSKPASSSASTSVPVEAPTSAPTATSHSADHDETHTGPFKTPLPHPLPTCKPTPPADLTPEQQKKYDDLLATAQSWTDAPISTARNAAKSPLTDSEKMWLTRDCLLRYLRATKWNQAEASKRLLATISWRREYGVEGLTPEHISPENETGKQLIFGYDNDARPCLYLNPGRQNTSYSPRQNQHLVFMLERVIELMPPGQENLALLINYKDTSSGKKGPGLSQGKEVLNILQNHYPERLGRCLISDLPWFITTFYKLITPFIDPVTRPKLKFNPILPEHVPASQLVATVGGDVEFEYAHDVYWPALNRLCEERREAYRRRWEDGGKRVGESERVLRGGEVQGEGEGVEKITEGVREVEVKG